MKNLSLIINVVLGIAVAVLYVLHFTSPRLPEEIRSGYEEEGEYVPGSLEIVYVNFDTLLNNYDMYFDLQKQFLEKQQTLEGELNTSSRSYEREVVDFQDKVQKGLVTRSQAQQMELELMQVQQELVDQRDEYSRELMEEEQVMNRQLQHSIYDFLDEYNKEHNYHYILSHSFGGPFLYTDKDLNITRDVIDRLNSQYRQSMQR
ncbi:MAG: OmpH family outer membrane protein [Bacteroidales bacterium]